MAQWINKKQKL